MTKRLPEIGSCFFDEGADLTFLRRYDIMLFVGKAVNNVLKEERVLHSSEAGDTVLLSDEKGGLYVRKSGRFDTAVLSAAAGVSSPYVARIVSFSESEIITEYVPGNTLSASSLPQSQLYDIIYELCGGLEALHGAGVIHRDIKPSNIILGDDGHIRIIDFGTARLKKPDTEKDTLLIGTDGFAPPEQYGFTQTDERSDIYALGVTIKLLLKEKYESSAIKAVAEKCMRFDPDKRYRTAAEVKKAVKLRQYRFLFLLCSVVSAAALLILTFNIVLNSSQSEISLSDTKETLDLTAQASITKETTSLTAESETQAPVTKETASLTTESETQAPETKETTTLTTESETQAPETKETASLTTESETQAPETNKTTSSTTEIETQAPVTKKTTSLTTESETQAPETKETTSSTTESETQAPVTKETTPLTAEAEESYEYHDPSEIDFLPEDFPELPDGISYINDSEHVKRVEWEQLEQAAAYSFIDSIYDWCGESANSDDRDTRLGRTVQWSCPDVCHVIVMYVEDTEKNSMFPQFSLTYSVIEKLPEYP